MPFYARYPDNGGNPGTVTQIDTGTGLIGGPITTTGTISIDDTGVLANTYVSPTITVNAQGQITAAVDGTSGRFVELHVISAPEAAAKQITLSASPQTPNQTGLTIANAPGQYYGDDFQVSGNVLSWSGLGLDGIIAAGDRFTIEYN